MNHAGRAGTMRGKWSLNMKHLDKKGLKVGDNTEMRVRLISIKLNPKERPR